MAFKVPEEHRVKKGFMRSSLEKEGNNGLFCFDKIIYKKNIHFVCIASDGLGWEHVSVSISEERTPNWDEMNMIKNIFWDEEDTVIQFHPKKSEYINNHQYVLHLWKKINFDYELPPRIFV